jgi:hypothetical protein
MIRARNGRIATETGHDHVLADADARLPTSPIAAVTGQGCPFMIAKG